MTKNAVIVSAVRTPIGRMGGALATLPPHYFGAEVIKEAMKRSRVTEEMVDDIVMGNVIGGGGNLARLSGLKTGNGITTPGLTIDRQCGSGISAIHLVSQYIKSGEGDIYIAGGIESYSQAPYLMKRSERAYSMAPPEFIRQKLSPTEIGDPPMGITAENLADKYKISREEQDEYALKSQQKMKNALEKGYFKEQIIPIHVRQKNKEIYIFDRDEHPRPNSTMEGLSSLPPAFLKNGTVTAGNSSGLNDAACALVIMSEEKAKELKLKPMAYIKEHAVTGVDPNIMGIGPVQASLDVLEKANLTFEDFDLIELNEAFAAQVLACDRELNLDMNIVNVNGGAIAHGHPLGATGAILATKTVYELERIKGKRALLTACIGGGQGIALIIERTI